MSSETKTYRGYTIAQQSNGTFYICGLKYVTPTLAKAVAQIDEYLASNDKARQQSVLKEAKKSAG